MTLGFRSRQELARRTQQGSHEPLPSWAWGLVFAGCAGLLALLVYFEAFKR